ncbi:hypothetical protein CJ430_31425, partial [Klebsiella pneumoniae]
SPSQTNLAQTWAQEARFTLDDGESAPRSATGTLLQRDALDSPSQTNLAQTWAQEARFTLDDGESAPRSATGT